MRKRSLLATVGAAAVAVVTATAPATAAPETTDHASGGGGSVHCPQLSKELEWHGDNRERLQQVIDERGRCHDHGRSGHGQRPVAAFDWDNTITKNDTTDTVLAWALEHDKILRPAKWTDINKWLTPAADRALTEACGTDVPVGAPLPTSTNIDCTDEIFSLRTEAKTMAGDEGFEGEWNHRRTVPEYAWVGQLFAGHTVSELRHYASQARDEWLAAPVGAERQVGSHTMHGYVRYYDQQRDLIKTLQRAGFEVYIVSAGVEPVTEQWAEGVGIDRKHTIGIRNITDRGRLTPYNEGCGDEKRVVHGDSIPYIDGKRCWINQEIYGVHGADAWERQAWHKRIAVGGGDADTDVTFVDDATGAHLVLNRNKNEINCRAYDNEDGRWVLNPMFIDPEPRMKGTYPCSTEGYTNPDGSLGPVLRHDGSVIPDQRDTIHG
ncbi:HAD family hydrolase [Streptomyces sulphureus]|uniref:HAD family hydrolase n=1 Tax=Streptomyces sulphureus TaxID=47758 RepID=UPI0003793D43|nr:haloacid dehalogenase-like hydrolase [Streptomyces sulphureus]